MKRVLPLVTMLLTVSTFCVGQADSLQQQINLQVWKPFIESFNNLDAKGFMTVHSKEMTRVIQDGKAIFGYDVYYRENERGNEQARKSNNKRTLELRFTQRIAGSDRAFEVGYYKYTDIHPDGSKRYGYGKFHVLLRKEAGAWKILMDADARDKTDEAVFLSANPM